jgi:hypothetical protein
MDFQTGKIQKDPLKTQSINEQYYESLYEEYKERELNEFTTTRIIIPKGTKMMVWDDHRSFVGDTLTYLDAWKNRGDHYYKIPKGQELSTEHTSNRDIDIPLVVWSTLMSHIIADKTHTKYSILENQERYGLWVKMYETPTYIPQLDKKIMAYGVWEQDIPEHINIKNNVVFPVSGKAMMTPPGARVNIKRAYTSANPLTGGTTVPGNTNVWVCGYCGGDTSQIEYDYLSGTNHLSCELQNSMGANC